MFLFPFTSITVQTTVVTPPVKVAGALFVTEATLQLSEVIGVPKTNPVATQVAPAFTVIFAGGVILGNTWSSIVTTHEENLTLSPVSVAIINTVFGPTSAHVNELGIVNKVTVQLSEEPASIIDGVKLADPF